MRTLIFGAGTDCARLLGGGLPAEEILGLLDNDPARHGTSFHGHRILAPAALATLAYDRIRIASSATTAIYRQLLALGVPEEKIESPLLEPANRRRLAALRGKHAGRPAVIVGNGPSLQIADLDVLAASDAVTFAFNKIFLAFDRTAFRPTYYMVEDFLVAENNAAAIDALRGMPKLFPEVLLRWVKQDDDTILFGLTHQDPAAGVAEFSEDPLDLKWGSSVTYTAIELAFYLGCDPVYLIGVDFKFDVPAGPLPQVLAAGGERNHFLPHYRQPGERWNKPMIEFTRLAYEAAYAHAQRTGRRIYNATRGGALEVFPRDDFDAQFPARAIGGPVASPAAAAGGRGS